MKKYFFVIIAIITLFFSCNFFEEETSLKKIKGYPETGEQVFFAAVNISGDWNWTYKSRTGKLPSTGGGSRLLTDQSRSNKSAINYRNRTFRPGLPGAAGHCSRNYLPIALTPSRSRGNAVPSNYDHIYDYSTGDSVNVSLVSEGSSSLIYCQTSKIDKVDQSVWDNLSDEFDKNIMFMAEHFGQFADIDENDKVMITFFDMPALLGEDYADVGGYFFVCDLFDDVASVLGFRGVDYANRRDLININLEALITTRDTEKYHDKFIDAIIVHELQHLINASHRLTKGRRLMDTWMDEALSELAMGLVYGSDLQSNRIDYFNEDPDDLIKDGYASLTVWEGDYYNYSLSYMFGSYLLAQCGLESGFIKKIIDDEREVEKAVADVVTSINSSFNSYADIIRGFYVANLLQNTQGIFSYGDMYTDFDIMLYSPTRKITELDPSTAVYYKSDLKTLQNTIRLGKQGKFMTYILIVDGDVYYVKNGYWVKQ